MSCTRSNLCGYEEEKNLCLLLAIIIKKLLTLMILVLNSIIHDFLVFGTGGEGREKFFLTIRLERLITDVPAANSFHFR